MPEPADALANPVTWQPTAAAIYPFATRIDQQWWVLRLNSFPDHPLYTLFVDAAVVCDVEDLRTNAPTWNLNPTNPPLTPGQRAEVLSLMRGLGPYGSEVNQPCDGDWCSCSERTDDPIP